MSEALRESCTADADEVWADIPGYGGLYQASTRGQIRSIDRTIKSGNRVHRIRGQLIKQRASKWGYLCAHLSKDGRTKNLLVHRLVLFTFAGQSRLQVRHLDGNPANNRLDNLQYGTAKDNARDRDKHGTTQRGTRHYKAKICPADVRDILTLKVHGLGPAAIGRIFGMSRSHVHGIVSGQSWALESADLRKALCRRFEQGEVK